MYVGDADTIDGDLSLNTLLSKSDMGIEGSNFNDPTRCYMPIFKHNWEA